MEGIRLDTLENIEQVMPFPIKGFDCDNGSEFLNWHLVRYLDNSQRKRPVQFTRARAYHKNDNAHIENKNWTHIRQYIGYQRFDHPELVEMLNQIYTTEWRLYFNYFMPSVKLVEKERIGAKINKKYDQPKTPVQVPEGKSRFMTTRRKEASEKGFVGYETIWEPRQKEVEYTTPKKP